MTDKPECVYCAPSGDCDSCKAASARAVSDPTVANHKWFDPECGVNGCQSLVWKARAETVEAARKEERKACEAIARDNSARLRYKMTRPGWIIEADACDEIADAIAARSAEGVRC